MPTEAQKSADAANAQHSTGPKTAVGKAASSQNNYRLGLGGGVFEVLPWESQQAYNDLLLSLLLQHQPQTGFEERLVQKIAQHFWLSERAVRLQDLGFHRDVPMSADDPGLKLYLRYQAAHDRAFHKLSDELRKLRNDARKQQIGFESQKAEEAAETRREAAESRKQNEEIRRAAADSRCETAEIRKSEIHSKRLAVLDAQIERLATSKPLNSSTAKSEAAVLSQPKTPNWRSEAA